MSKNIENMLVEALERLRVIEDSLTVLTVGKVPKKRSLAGIVEVPLSRREVLRDAELRRIFARLCEMTASQKTKANFPQYVIQAFGNAAPLEVVPQSILVNRCELLKAFWPGRDEDNSEPRAVVLAALEKAIERGDVVRCTMADYVPATRLDRSGETVLILSPAEAKRRKISVDDDEAEEEAAAPPTKTERKPKFWEEDFDAGDPAAKPVVEVEVEGFRSPRAAAPKKSWSIGEDGE